MTTQNFDQTAAERIARAQAKRARQVAARQGITAVVAPIEAAQVAEVVQPPVPAVQIKSRLFAADAPLVTPEIVAVRSREFRIPGGRFRDAFRAGADSTKPVGYVGALKAGLAAMAELHFLDEVYHRGYFGADEELFLGAAQAAYSGGALVNIAINAGNAAVQAKKAAALAVFLKPAVQPPAPRIGKTARKRDNKRNRA